MTLRSIALFVLAAVLEIGGAWLVWQGVREHRGWLWIGVGIVSLGLYGLVAAQQPDAGRAHKFYIGQAVELTEFGSIPGAPGCLAADCLPWADGTCHGQ